MIPAEKPARRRQDGVAEEVELQPRKRNSKMRRMYTLLTKQKFTSSIASYDQHNAKNSSVNDEKDITTISTQGKYSDKQDTEKQQAKFAQLINFSLEPQIRALNRRVECLNDRTLRDMNFNKTANSSSLVTDGRRQSLKQRNNGVSKTVKFVEDI